MANHKDVSLLQLLLTFFSTTHLGKMEQTKLLVAFAVESGANSAARCANTIQTQQTVARSFLALQFGLAARSSIKATMI